MNKDKVINKLLKNNRHFSNSYRILLGWNEKEGLSANCERIGIHQSNAYRYIGSYKLKFKLDENSCLHKRDYKKISKDCREKYFNKWNSRLTIKQNAKNIGISTPKAHVIARRYSFPYLKVTKRNAIISIHKIRNQERLTKMKALSSLGFNQRQIGNIMGISRERVRQLL